MTKPVFDTHATALGSGVPGRLGGFKHPSGLKHLGGPRRLGGLDGLRAIAVGLVLVYHLFPSALPGGFLGVDIFFVISGFLIASLLLSEHHRTGRLALVSFWRRRARRLLPALALVLLVSTSAALLVGGDLLVNLGAQIGGAAFFVANWVYIALGADYFAQDNPELFRNMWSLAIEEQFYLFLPLILLFAFRMRSRASRALLFGLLGGMSAVWMSTLFAEGAPATRVYFGTDTHIFGLLLGVALACALRPRAINTIRGDKFTPPRPLAVWQQIGLIAIGVAGFTVVGYLAATLREGSPESFMGGFQIATIAMLLIVWAATREGAWFGRALDVQPLRWIGERSYGIYLWHWPILLIIGALARQSGPALWGVPLITLALTLSFAALSYRFIEQPVRRIGLWRSLGALFRPVRLNGRRLALAGAVILLLIVTVPATAYAIVTAPVQSSSADAISRGEAALAEQNARAQQGSGPGSNTDSPAPSDTATDGSHSPGAGFGTDSGSAAGGSATGGGSAMSDLAAAKTGWVESPGFEAPLLPPIDSSEIFAVGDSVMLASVPELVEAFPSIWVDASVSRGLASGVGIVEQLASQRQLRPVLVVGLGTNGPVQDSDLDALLRVADGRRIVLVNAYGDRWWVPEVNEKLRAFADKHRGVTLADWQSAVAGVPGALAGDDIHPNPSGGVIYAEAVQAALDELRERQEQPRRGTSR